MAIAQPARIANAVTGTILIDAAQSKRGMAMSPDKQRAKGIGGCVVALGNTSYGLKDGVLTYAVAIPLSLVRAEPCLRRFAESSSISCEEAMARGYRIVRSYDEAVVYGLA
jgi:hypothetical protein